MGERTILKVHNESDFGKIHHGMKAGGNIGGTRQSRKYVYSLVLYSERTPILNIRHAIFLHCRRNQPKLPTHPIHNLNFHVARTVLKSKTSS